MPTWSFRHTSAALLVSLVASVLPISSADAAPIAANDSSEQQTTLLSSPEVKQLKPHASGRNGAAKRHGEPKKVRELKDRRSASSATWVNNDGSLTVERYLAPRYFKEGGDWKPINTDLSRVPGTDEWTSGANEWSVTFSTPDDPDGTVQFNQPGADVTFTPRDVQASKKVPTVSGQIATYSDLWPSADLVQEVFSTQVKETILVADRDASASYDFDLEGATPHLEDDGSVQLTADGKAVGWIPAATVETADSKVVPGRTEGANPRLELIDGGIRVSVSGEWLSALPEAAFPVAIDPTYAPGSFHPTTVRSYSSLNASSTSEVRLGTNASGTWASAVSVAVPSAPAPLNGQPWKLGFASMVVFCGVACNLTAPQGWNPATTPTSYTAIQSGPSVSTAFEPIGDGLYVFAGNSSSWRSGTSPWLGFKATSSTYLAIPTSNIFFSYRYYELPPPSSITAPTAGSTITTATPTLKTTAPTSNVCANISSTGTCDQPGNIYYNFKVRTAPASQSGQVVAESGWINGPYSTNGSGNFVLGTPSWTVPTGSLIDGVTYYVTAQVTNTLILYASDENSGNILITPTAGPESTFKVKLRLAAGGPSATDSVGSVPGKAKSESAGSPSPGVGNTSATVNLVTGNLSIAVATPQMQSIAGNAGVTLTYDSTRSSTSGAAATGGTSYGLRGQYYKDAGGGHTFPSSPPVGTRIDPTVDLNGGFASAPIGGIDVNTGSAGAGFMVRWSGRIALPSASGLPAGTTFKVGGTTTGGMRVSLNGSMVYDNWSGTATPAGTRAFGTALAPGTTGTLQVEYWEPNTASSTKMQFWVDQINSASQTHAEYLVPSAWLQTASTGMPPGWNYGASDVSWRNVADLGSQIVVNGAAGETLTFTREADGSYSAPPNTDNALSVSAGLIHLSTASGLVYVFNSDGTLKSAVTAFDDTKPAKLLYTYTQVGAAPTSPVLLKKITDPVSNRYVALVYGGESSCPSTNAAPDGMLCQIVPWDGTVTQLMYNANQQFAALVAPSNSRTLFAYTSDNRLSAIRDVSASDYVAAGLPGSSGCSATCQFDTAIAYDSAGRVASVTQPAPVPSAARPTRSYTYQPSGTNPGAGTSLVQIAGFNPAGNAKIPAGYAWSQSYDSQGRIVGQIDSSGLGKQVVWNNESLPIIQVDAAGLQTSTVYDDDGNPTDVYGPAPRHCFTAGAGNPWPTDTDFASPPLPIKGYLPVANPIGTALCATEVPHGQTRYDENFDGLGAIYWPNGDFAGAPERHGTGNGIGTLAAAPCTGASGSTSSTSLCATWQSGSAPGGVDGQNKWSMRLSGNLKTSSAGDYEFKGTSDQALSLWIDGKMVGTNKIFSATGALTGIGPQFIQQVSLDAGNHDVRLDLQGSKAVQTAYTLSDRKIGSTSLAPVVLTRTSPAYGLETSSIDADGKQSSTSYSAPNGIAPQYRLATSETKGVGSSTPLSTTTTYETPGPTTYLRKVATTLPTGAQTTYGYWGDTDATPSNICAVPSGTPQGGMLKAITGPAPTSSGTGRVQYLVYDAMGRVSARWIGPASTSFASVPASAWRCTTRDSRGRVLTETWPAIGSSPARTVTHNYGLYGSPYINSVTDSASLGTTISAATDALGRMVTYVDAFGQTTEISYNQVGQITQVDGPQGVQVNTYDPNTGNPKVSKLDGADLATSTYDSATQRLSSVDYANGTRASIEYDLNGRKSGLVYRKSSDNSLVTGNQVTTSAAGRVLTELQNINGTMQNANPAGSSSNDYTYDAIGRLTSAYLPGSLVEYGYGTSAASLNCEQPDAGANTNRTKVTVTPTGGTAKSTQYCYNDADQVTKRVAGGTITLVGTAQGGQNLNFLQPNTPLALNYPSGTAEGDQSLLAVGVTKGTTITVPAGYTTVGTYSTSNVLGANLTFQVMRKTIEAGETSVSVAFSKSDTRTAIVAVYRGVDQAAPIDTTTGSFANTGTTVSAPSATTTVAKTQLVMFAAGKGSSAATWTPPSGATIRATSSGGGSVTSVASDSTQLAAGASGAQTSTSSNSGALATILVALKPGESSTPSTFDERGNQLTDGATTFTYDSADRLVSTVVGGVTTTYVYDPVGRLMTRTTSGTPEYYGYGGYTDQPVNTRTGTGVIQQIVGLPGGVTKTIQSGGTNLWSYSDLRGNTTVTTNDSGMRVGDVANYDPWGTAVANPVSAGNEAVTAHFTSFGGQGKVTDQDTGITIMGARAYNAAQGRFLTVDPEEGGCANAYVYVYGDPLSQEDLTGRESGCGKKLFSAALTFTGYALATASIFATGGTSILILGVAGTAVSVVGATLSDADCRAGNKYSCTSQGVSIAGALTGIPGTLLAVATRSAPWTVASIIGRLLFGLGAVGTSIDVVNDGPSTWDCVKGGIKTGFGLWG